MCICMYVCVYVCTYMCVSVYIPTVSVCTLVIQQEREHLKLWYKCFSISTFLIAYKYSVFFTFILKEAAAVVVVAVGCLEEEEEEEE